MQIYISEETRIRDIQEMFQTIYPYLRMEFFRKPHDKGEYSPEEDSISPDTPVEKVGMRNVFGWLDISYYRTAAAVEYDLNHFFGLNAQVLRKAGTLWLETLSTDNWTLEALNNAGKPEKHSIMQFQEKRDRH